MLDFIASIGTLFRDSLWAKIIAALIVLLLILLVIIPLIGKLRRKRLKSKESKDMLKDLMTWKHLTQLVRGGDEHRKAKEALSNNLARIDGLLKQGFECFARYGSGLYRIPWFILLGEPRSGKSSLLQASELELAVSAEEQSFSYDDGKNSIPIRLWVGNQAVICDVSGKVFFDRWFDGSSAEWHHLLKQLCRKRRRRPLEGAILTIPADALLADDEALTDKKAILMAHELGQLLQISGMYLPCYVVVTKLDMIHGFREYTKGITGDLRHQIVGYENNGSLYDMERFKQFWDALVQRLWSGAKQMLCMDSIVTLTANRMDLTGKIYGFPDNFNFIYEHLHTYLKILFGEDNFQGTKQAVFAGVFFTSSTDIGVSFSPALAALAGKKTDDLPVPAENRPKIYQPAQENTDAAATALIPFVSPLQSRSYFIRDMLHQRIFNPSAKAFFTRKKWLIQHIPHYLVCIAMVILGIGWLISAAFKTDRVRVSLLHITAYYDWLGSVLRKNTPFSSGLISKDETDRYTLDRTPVIGEQLSSRVQFYFDALNYRDMPVRAPFGFRLSEKFVFGFEHDMGYRDRAFIANQLHNTMVRMPLITNTGSRFIVQQDQATLDKNTRDTIHSFMLLLEVKDLDFHKLFVSDKFKLEPLIRYLLPDIPADSVHLLKSYKPHYDRNYSFNMDANYIYSGDFLTANKAALNLMISAWRRSAAYPDSLYGKIKQLVMISEEITVNYMSLTELLQRVNEVVLYRDVEQAVFDWKNLMKRQETLINRGRAVFDEVKDLMNAAHLPLGFESAPAAVSIPGARLPAPLDAFGSNLINTYLFNDMVLNYAVKEYYELFDADIEFLKSKSGNGGPGDMGEVLSLKNEFAVTFNREVQNLQRRTKILQSNELLTVKVGDGKEGVSLFTVVENILRLASDITIPSQDQLVNTGFDANWQKGQNTIKAAADAFELYAKAYMDNEKAAPLIANARTMLLAQAYINRYIIFSTSLYFLFSTEPEIAAVVSARSADPGVAIFSSRAIQSSVGDINFNRSYDSAIVKPILDDVSAFASLFGTPEEQKDLPKFLQQADRSMYEPQAFMSYLGSYIRYWGNYPDTMYVPAVQWNEFKTRVSRYRSYEVNTLLQGAYTRSIDALNHIPALIISKELQAEAANYSTALTDQFNLLSSFLNSDAARTLAVWDELPAGPLEAFNLLRQVPDQELKETYLTVYSGKKDIRIAWWDNFTVNGVTILSRAFTRQALDDFTRLAPRLEAFPFCSDADKTRVLSAEDVETVAALFSSMGVASDKIDAASDKAYLLQDLIHPNLFKGYVARTWAQTLYDFAEAFTDSQKPLVWTLSQPPIDTQNSAAKDGRLLAANRFRYIEVSSAEKTPQRFSTYMNRKLTLAQGNPADSGLTLRFYKISTDREPAAEVCFDNRWSIFNLYFRRDRVTDENGQAYIPIFFNYESQQYVYFVEVSFNSDIPKPEKWYTGATWPAITVMNGTVNGSR
ncbi:MAG: hypothetical protein LBD55_00045 [Treponema sp.]|jgi:hypothetical protein|nr:hypothetical protein [Treponema sp.]